MKLKMNFNVFIVITVVLILSIVISCKENRKIEKKEKLKNKSEIIKLYNKKMKAGHYLYVVNTYKRQYMKFDDPDLSKIYNDAYKKSLVSRAKNKIIRDKKKKERLRKLHKVEGKRLKQELAQQRKYGTKAQYKDKLFNSQVICNSVIPQKFPNIKRSMVTKNIILGYLDHVHGQHGFKGSGKKVQAYFDNKNQFSRWTWTINRTGRFVKCIVNKDESYRITLESL